MIFAFTLSCMYHKRVTILGRSITISDFSSSKSSFFCFFLCHQISFSRGKSLHLDAIDVCQLSSETHQTIYLQRTADTLLQIVENLCRRHILALRLVFHQVETHLEILLYRRNHLKLTIALHQQCCLHRVEIRFFASSNRRHRLRKKLDIIRFDAHIDRCISPRHVPTCHPLPR